MSLRAVLARNLRKLRQANSLSQEELAHGAGVTANYVSSLEREQYAASLDVVERLAAALGVDPVELIRSS
jgi:transcriptional regulator with XRE-family HTH domain